MKSPNPKRPTLKSIRSELAGIIERHEARKAKDERQGVLVSRRAFFW